MTASSASSNSLTIQAGIRPTSTGPSPPEGFRLTAHSASPDPRNNAYRGDLAELSLAGRVVVPRYALAVPRRISVPAVALRAKPSDRTVAVSELLLGEEFWLLDSAGGWAWGRCGHDDYVGYLPETALAALEATPTHIVSAITALVFSEADIKAPLVARWPAGAQIHGTIQGDFLATRGGFVHRRHLRPLNQLEVDPVAAAERLIGVPYLWGGRSGAGIDCSGLIQQSLAAAGIAAPRDSDQQRALGHEVSPGAPLLRGDLIFFPGHVGLMIDGGRLIHANAYWMAVAVEPLATVIERLRPTIPEPVVAIRRL